MKNPKLEVGDFITVDHWNDPENKSFRGDCLEVKVIDKNLIRAQIRGASAHLFGSHGGLFTIDLDKAIVRHLSVEFIESCISVEVDSSRPSVQTS